MKAPRVFAPTLQVDPEPLFTRSCVLLGPLLQRKSHLPVSAVPARWLLPIKHEDYATCSSRTHAPKASNLSSSSMLAERLLSGKHASTSHSSTGFAGICVADRSRLSVPSSARQPIAEQHAAAGRTLAQLTHLWRCDHGTCHRLDLRSRSGGGTPATRGSECGEATLARSQPAQAATCSEGQRTARQLSGRAGAARLCPGSVMAAARHTAQPWGRSIRQRRGRGTRISRCR